jgi:hypothetical protein
MRRLLALASLLLLTACANQPLGEYRTDTCFAGYVDEAKLLAQMAAAQPSATSIDKLPFVVPELNQAHLISRTAPVFDFPSGRSRYVALDLAGYPSDRLHLMTRDIGLTAPIDATCAAKMESAPTSPYGRRALIPVVTWLDEQRQVIAAGVSGSHAVLGRGEAQSVGWGFDRPKGARFVAIHALPGTYGSVVVIDAPRYTSMMAVPVGTGIIFIPTAGGGPTKLVGASTGVFMPLLTRYMPRGSLPTICASSPEIAGCKADETVRTPAELLGPPDSR